MWQLSSKDLLTSEHCHRHPVKGNLPNLVIYACYQARKDQLWANSREQWIAAAAAGVHIAMFAYNLSFWGSEGMPPDRYWPDNTRWVKCVCLTVTEVKT